MTPAELAYWRKAQRRAAQLEPELAAALLRAFAILRDSLPPRTLAQLVESGDVDRLFREHLTPDVFARAFIPYREKFRRGTEQAIRFAIRDLPKAGMVDGVVAVAFDVLSPRVIDAIRTLESKVITNATDGVRETLRAFVENGLRDGRAPAAVARELRATIGLAPNQEAEVRNFRRALEEAHDSAKALDYRARDRRFDATLRKARASGERIPAEKVDRMVEAYRKRRIAINAATNANTAALDAQKAANRLAWSQAADAGVVDGDRLEKTWRGTLDDREREEHLAMEGETVPFDAPFSNGEMVPGQSTYNCRCIAIYRVASAR